MKIISKIIGFACTVKDAVTDAASKAKSKVGQASTALAVGLMTAYTTIMPSFAAAEDYVVFQSSDLEPILEGAKANLAVIIPVGVGLITISFGLGWALSMLRKFKKT